MNRLTERERRNILLLIEDGKSQREIAKLYGVCNSTISRLEKRYRQTGSHNYLQDGGNQKKINPRTERFLVREARTRKTICSRRLNEIVRLQTRIRVCDRTIRMTLNRNNLRYLYQNCFLFLLSFFVNY